MILFFETYSIIQVLLLSRFIKKAKVIYFHKRSFPILRHNPHLKKSVERCIRFFNKQVKIETLPAKKINEHNWILNKKSVEFVENKTKEIESTSIYRSLLKIVGDKNLLKGYKMQLVDSISTRLLYFQVAKDLIEDQKENSFLIPTNNKNSKIQNYLFSKELLDPFFLPGSSLSNKIKDSLRKIYVLIIYLLLPFFFVVKNIKRITFKKIDKRTYDIAMPVMSGFHEKDILIKGVKKTDDDSYLYGRKITLGHVVHIFNHWTFPSEVEKEYKDIMNRKGIPLIDSKDYKINMNFLLTATKIQLKLILHLLLRFFFWFDRNEYIFYGNRMIYWMLKKYLELENVDYKVELIRHDYNPNHIIETILCNKHNKKTVGIQHGATAGPYIHPQLSYVHLDKYCVFSDRHCELYSPFWDNINLGKTGNYRIDQLVKISKDHSLILSVKNKINTLYGPRKHIATILFPGEAERNLDERWEAIYDALHEIKSMDTDCNIFLRFKRTKTLEAGHIKQFKNLPQIDSRFILDHKNFTTIELMAASDLIISNLTSSGIIEATVFKKKVFTFDYAGYTKYSFEKYGKDLILTSKKDVLNLFKNLNNDSYRYDCDWPRLKKEFNYFYDGKCLDRIQEVLWDTIQEVTHG